MTETPPVWCVYEGAETRCVDTRGNERTADLHMMLLKHMERGHTLVTHTGSFRAHRGRLQRPPSRCWGPPDSEMKMCTRVSDMAPAGTFPVDIDGKWHDLCVGNPTLMNRSPFCSDAQRGQGGLASIQTKRKKDQALPAKRKRDDWHRFRLAKVHQATAAPRREEKIMEDIADFMSVSEASVRRLGPETFEVKGVDGNHVCVKERECKTLSDVSIERLSGPFCRPSHG